MPKHARRPLAVFALTALALSLAGCVTPATYNADTLRAAGVLSGSVIDETTCQSWSDTAVWVHVDDDWDTEYECLRYFAAGLSDRTSLAHVWFHGDVMTQSLEHEAWVGDWYDETDPEKLAGFAKREFETYGTPYIRFGRPGVYGSSGFHKERRRAREARIIDAALDALKARYGIERLALSGQSGGGHVVASLLTVRDDITCAVITSGVTSVAQRADLHGWPTDITGYRDFFDPIDHVDAIPAAADRRILVVGDPRDRNTPFETQAAYAAAVAVAGHRVGLIRAEGTGRSHHGLTLTGFKVMQWCLEGVPDDAIQARLPIPAAE